VRGAFITLEGGEGAGKSTQARRLAQRLRARGVDVVLTREPGGSSFAERMRLALLGEAGRTLDPTAQALMFAAARADHVDTVIAPALAQGRTVICDRFCDSTTAYQGTGGVPEPLLRALEAVAVGDVRPDLTIILDVPPEEGLRRARSRQVLNVFEEDAIPKHEARRDAFLRIAEREPGRCVVLDGTLPADDLAGRILRVVEERLPSMAAA